MSIPMFLYSPAHEDDRNLSKGVWDLKHEPTGRPEKRDQCELEILIEVVCTR
jgi:hypothetical protein